MQLIESSNQYLINDTEYFYNLTCPIYHPERIKAYIPKLMANIPHEDPNIKKDSISTTLFINAKECRPTPNKIITLQNFITLTRPDNLSPSFWQTSIGGVMIKNKKHVVKITNKDIRKMHFIEDK